MTPTSLTTEEVQGLHDQAAAKVQRRAGYLLQGEIAQAGNLRAIRQALERLEEFAAELQTRRDAVTHHIDTAHDHAANKEHTT